MSLLTLLLSLLPVATRAAECTSSFADMWKGFASGENAYVVEMKDGVSPDRPQGDGMSFFSYCLPKGNAGGILNPFIETKLHRSMFWQFGKLACQGETEILRTTRRRLESSSGESGSGGADEFVTANATFCASYNEKYGVDVCKYPGPPAGLELIPDRGTEQNSWYGPLLQVPNVNGEDLNNFDLDSTEEIRHTTIAGVEGGSACTRTESEGTMTFYDGGVMGEVRRSANLVYRSFQFKKPADRAAAIAVSTDTVNPGLKYAHSFAGLNGCSIEIVLEVSIKPGGGAELTGSFPLESMALDREKAVRGSVSVCKTAEEIIAFAGVKELRESQNVEHDVTCESGNREILRFSRTFVCKATGEIVEASFEFETAAGPVREISSDCSIPTAYKASQGAEGMVLHQSASFKMILDSSQAPESCGAMYWDPLISPLDFGAAAAAVEFAGEEGEAGPDEEGFPLWILGPILGGVALVAIATWWFKCRKAAGEQGKANSV